MLPVRSKTLATPSFRTQITVNIQRGNCKYSKEQPRGVQAISQTNGFSTAELSKEFDSTNARGSFSRKWHKHPPQSCIPPECFRKNSKRHTLHQCNILYTSTHSPHISSSLLSFKFLRFCQTHVSIVMPYQNNARSVPSAVRFFFGAPFPLALRLSNC